MSGFERYSKRILAAFFCAISLLVAVVLFGGRHTPSVLLQQENIPVSSSDWFYYDNYGYDIPVRKLPAKIPATGHVATLYHKIGDENDNQLYLCFFSEHQTIRVTVDDEVIYQYENEPRPRWLKTYRAFYHIVALPENLQAGSLVGIRTESKVGEYDGSYSPILIGYRNAIFQDLLRKHWKSFVLGIAMLVGALFLLATSILFVQSLKDFTFLYLALLIVCIGLWQLEESRLLQFFFGYQPLHWFFEYGTQLFIPFITFLFLQSINDKAVLVVTPFIFWMIAAVLFLQLFLQVTGLAAITSTLFLSHVLYAGMCFYLLTAPLKQPWLKKSRMRYLMAGTMVGAVGIFVFTFVSLLQGRFYSGALGLGLALAFFSMILLTYHKELQFFRQASQTAVYRDLAFIDLATGAHNKTAWFTLIDEFNDQSPHGEYGLILFDMNNLKKLNDLCGHTIGDRVIKAFAYCLMEAADKRGTIYRIGGDEFVCLCYGDPREKVATILSEFDKIVECQKDSDHPFSAAYGFTFFSPKTPHDFQVAIDEADAKMYLHKQLMKQGRSAAGVTSAAGGDAAADEILEELPAI